MKNSWIPSEEELIEIGFEKKEMRRGYIACRIQEYIFTIDKIIYIRYSIVDEIPEGFDMVYNKIYPRSKEALIDFISNFSQNE